jgi:hypothetical protein
MSQNQNRLNSDQLNLPGIIESERIAFERNVHRWCGKLMQTVDEAIARNRDYKRERLFQNIETKGL